VTLFCYGSLQFAEVMRAVTGRSFAHEPARLDGWRRRCFRGRSFPAVAPDASASTPGVLWRGVDERSARLLDAFEGDAYERRVLRVRTSRGETLDANVYVASAAGLAELSQQPWLRERFARESLAAFLRALRR
jgi:gamma-glutamylcyclotransferase (GGCT)/AIG2-like uncharacterized protein YtfP